MASRIIATAIIFLMVAGNLSATAAGLVGCTEPVCCCREAAADGRHDVGTVLRSVHDCCCQPSDGQTCRLRVVAASEAIGWALSSIRVAPPAFGLTGVIASSAAATAAASLYPHDGVAPGMLPGDVPTYLANMAFLC